MGRKKGGRNMKSVQRRIEIIPEWRDQPDIRMLAQAVIQIARKRHEDEIEAQRKPQSKEVPSA
jgi:hypothetical protein